MQTHKKIPSSVAVHLKHSKQLHAVYNHCIFQIIKQAFLHGKSWLKFPRNDIEYAIKLQPCDEVFMI